VAQKADPVRNCVSTSPVAATLPTGCGRLGRLQRLTYARLIPSSLSNRSQAIRQLQAIKFRRADSVAIQWTVEAFGKRTSVAAKETGYAALTKSRGGEVALYMVDPDPGSGHYYDETAAELAKFCGIRDPDQTFLLRRVLADANRKRTEEQLESLGYEFAPGRPEDGPDIGTFYLRLGEHR
jgi:hypothetical protein